jgi:Na+/H+ antiporter
VLNIQILVGLLAAVALLGAAARRIGVSYPVVLVLGGLAIGLIPGLPDPKLDPQLVLLVFLPPLVYSAAFRAASFELRANGPYILVLAVGLVLATLAAVALVGHAVVGLTWVAAFTLGALLSPTDPVSAGAIIRAVGAPERIVTILEGEALVNDGTGLAAFQVAVAAAGATGFSLGHGVIRFVTISVGGLAIGLAVGWISVRLRRLLDDPTLEITIGLLTAFGSYEAANAAGFSGVLAAVAAGVYAGQRLEHMTSAPVRLRTEPFWTSVTFLLESLLFLLIGLQFPHILNGLSGLGVGSEIGYGAAVVAAALAVRFLWMFTVTRLLPHAGRLTPASIEHLSAAELVVLAWSGMRGALSLAGALSIPLLSAGHLFPDRNQVIYLIYYTVLATLIVPSLTLQPLLQRLGLGESEQLLRQEQRARRRAIAAGLARLDELAAQGDVSEEVLESVRAQLQSRLMRVEAAGADAQDRRSPPAEQARRVRAEVIAAERRALRQMRAERGVTSEIVQRIQRDIDLDEARLH